MANAHAKPLRASLRSAQKEKKARVKAHVLSTFLFLLFNAVSVLACFERYPFVRAIPYSPFIIHHSPFPIPRSLFLK